MCHHKNNGINTCIYKPDQIADILVTSHHPLASETAKTSTALTVYRFTSPSLSTLSMKIQLGLTLTMGAAMGVFAAQEYCNSGYAIPNTEYSLDLSKLNK